MNEAVPVTGKAKRLMPEGTLYQVVDPCPSRNFFWLYILACADGSHWVVDEWPNRYDPVPGVGVMGEWAVPSGSKKHTCGQGPAQQSLGWSFWRYKKEMARVEGWDCYHADAKMEEVKAWDQMCAKKRPVFERLMDSRFASNELQSGEEVRTIYDEFEDLGLSFNMTSTGRREEVDAGVQMVNDALYYNPEQPVVKLFNEPKLHIHPRCENLIYCMKVWRWPGAGDDPAKDPCDALRYYFLKDCVYVPARQPGFGAGRGVY